MIGKFVAGEGNTRAAIMVIGEGPGQAEASIGRPFCGPAGQDLNRYLAIQAGVRRTDCWVTNIVKWRTDEQNSDPTEEDIRRDEPILLEEIAHVQPKIIVTVGRVATSYFLNSDVTMEFEYGLPHRCERFNCTVFPVYHPAAGLHQADKFSKLVYNSFRRLGAYLNGKLNWPKDIPNSYYSQPVGLSFVAYGTPPYLDNRIKEVALDTEGYENNPWGLSVTSTVGSGQVVKLNNVELFKAVVPYIDNFIFHNALWDLKVLRAMGIDIPYDKIEDTMLISHLLCLEPKKLKALAYRECGMEMEEYKDVIKEAEDRISREFIERIFEASICPTCSGLGESTRPWKKNPNKFTKEKCKDCNGDGTTLPIPATQLVFNDDFTARLYTPESTGRRLRSLLSSSGNLREGWRNLSDDVRSSIQARFGKIPEVSLDDVEPRERAINYSARDADATLRVWHSLSPRINSMGLDRAYKIDLACIPIIDRMHQNGILIDKNYFRNLDKQFEVEQYKVLQTLYEAAGTYFNPSSPPQLKKQLDKFGIRGLDSTKERDLRLLLIKKPELKPIIEPALKYRELNKMRGNYTTKLANQADENSRLHTTFVLSAQEGDDEAEAPVTGRFSSRNPNLQNIPAAETEKGALIRAGFIAAPGHVLLSCDLSQIELRVGAHLAQEPNMIEAFRSGKDLHTYTASHMFKVPYEKVDKKTQRYPAKSINFGIFYGMSKYRLQSELAVEGLIISLDEAQGFIDSWFEAYPGVKTYMHKVQAEARQNYYVRTMFGHIRYLPNVHSKDRRAAEEALRQAGNHPVQGSAGEVLKIAMANIHRNVYPIFQGMKKYFEPLLTIHDEVIFEMDEEIAEIASEMVKYEMENAVKLDVPLLSSCKIATDWSKLKD